MTLWSLLCHGPSAVNALSFPSAFCLSDDRSRTSERQRLYLRSSSAPGLISSSVGGFLRANCSSVRGAHGMSLKISLQQSLQTELRHFFSSASYAFHAAVRKMDAFKQIATGVLPISASHRLSGLGMLSALPGYSQEMGLLMRGRRANCCLEMIVFRV